MRIKPAPERKAGEGQGLFEKLFIERGACI